MTETGVADAEKMLTMDDDVERQRAADELECMERNIRSEAEASVEAADKAGDEQASIEAAETAAKAEELREATEQEFGD